MGKNKNYIGRKLNEDNIIFDEFNHVDDIIFKIRVREWQNNCTKVEEHQWCAIFEYMENKNIGLQTMSEIVEYDLVKWPVKMQQLKELFPA